MDRSVEELGYSDDDSGGDKGDQREYSSDEEDAFKAKKGKKKAIPGMEVDSDDEDAKAGKKSGKSKEDAGREDWDHSAELHYSDDGRIYAAMYNTTDLWISTHDGSSWSTELIAASTGKNEGVEIATNSTGVAHEIGRAHV